MMTTDVSTVHICAEFWVVPYWALASAQEGYCM